MAVRTFTAILYIILFSAGLESFASDVSSETLARECQEAVHSFNYVKAEKTALKLIEASKRCNDDNLLAEGKFYLGVAELFNGNPEFAKKHLDESRVISERKGNDTLTAKVLNSLGIYEALSHNNLYLAQAYFLRSARLAEEHGLSPVRFSAANNLSHISIELNDTTGIPYARERYEYGVKNNNIYSQFTGAANLSQLYRIKGDYDNALRYARIADRISRARSLKVRGQVALIYAQLNLAEGNLNKAERNIEEAVPLVEADQAMLLPDVWLTMGCIYAKKRENATARKYLEKALAEAELRSSSRKPAILSRLSAVCESLGDKDAALKYLKLHKAMNDKMRAIDIEQLNKEREMIVEKVSREKDMEMERIKANNRERIIIVLSVATALLVILVIVLIYNRYRLNRLYNSLVRQNQKSVGLLPPSLDTVRPDSGSPASIEYDDESGSGASAAEKVEKRFSEEASKELFEKVRRLMHEEHLYADPRLTRESLIERLGTNRTYFANAISRHSGMNYAQFLNRFRVEEAIRLLSDPKMADKPLKEICRDVGFGSATTFYKVFLTATGLSPSVFRKSANTLNNKRL